MVAASQWLRWGSKRSCNFELKSWKEAPLLYELLNINDVRGCNTRQCDWLTAQDFKIRTGIGFAILAIDCKRLKWCRILWHASVAGLERLRFVQKDFIVLSRCTCQECMRMGWIGYWDLYGFVKIGDGSRRMRFASGNVFHWRRHCFTTLDRGRWTKGDEYDLTMTSRKLSKAWLGIASELVPLEAFGWNSYISCACQGLWQSIG